MKNLEKFRKYSLENNKNIKGGHNVFDTHREYTKRNPDCPSQKLIHAIIDAWDLLTGDGHFGI